MPDLTYAVALAAPAADVWEFLIRPANVMTVTDPGSGVRLLSGPDVMAPGTANELEVTGFGLPQKVTYEVTTFQSPAGGAPGSFTETMTRGPMARFENAHHVAPVLQDDGSAAGCRVTDVFSFDPPGGLLGFVLTADRVTSELNAAMAYRHAALRDRFGAA